MHSAGRKVLAFVTACAQGVQAEESGGLQVVLMEEFPVQRVPGARCSMGMLPIVWGLHSCAVSPTRYCTDPGTPSRVMTNPPGETPGISDLLLLFCGGGGGWGFL